MPTATVHTHAVIRGRCRRSCDCVGSVSGRVATEWGLTLISVKWMRRRTRCADKKVPVFSAASRKFYSVFPDSCPARLSSFVQINSVSEENDVGQPWMAWIFVSFCLQKWCFRSDTLHTLSYNFHETNRFTSLSSEVRNSQVSTITATPMHSAVSEFLIFIDRVASP